MKLILPRDINDIYRKKSADTKTLQFLPFDNPTFLHYRAGNVNCNYRKIGVSSTVRRAPGMVERFANPEILYHGGTSFLSSSVRGKIRTAAYALPLKLLYCVTLTVASKALSPCLSYVTYNTYTAFRRGEKSGFQALAVTRTARALSRSIYEPCGFHPEIFLLIFPSWAALFAAALHPETGTRKVGGGNARREHFIRFPVPLSLTLHSFSWQKRTMSWRAERVDAVRSDAAMSPCLPK